MNDQKPKLLSSFTIYHDPGETPRNFVVRRWEIYPDGPKATVDIWTARTLVDARRLLPPGLVRFDRDTDDDFRIIESWL